MKILKVRRGFTTNSSAASEFIPPDALVAPGKPAPAAQAPPAQQSAAGGAKATTGSAKPFPIPIRTAPPDATKSNIVEPKPALPAETPSARPESAASNPTPVSSPAAVPAASPGAVHGTPPEAVPAAWRGWGNSVLVGGFAALVGLAFAAEKAVRRAIRRFKSKDEDD